MPDIFVSKKESEEDDTFASSEASESKKEEQSVKAAVSDTGPELEIEDSVMINHPLKAYVYKPRKVHFETKQKDEEVLLLLRKHPITNVPWILTAMIMILAPIVLETFPVLSSLPPNFGTIIIIAWYLLVSAYVLENFLIWFFNVSIVTNKRVVDIDFHNLLYKEVSDAELGRIEDVTYKMSGAIRTVFNYGDVIVQTASEVPNFDFLAVPKPDQVVKLLQQLRGRR